MRWIPVFLMLITISCQEDIHPVRVPLIVTVRENDGSPVPNAKILVDKKAEGITGQAGELQTTLLGPEGRFAMLEVLCPEGWIAKLGDTYKLTVRLLQNAQSEAGELIPIRQMIRCDPMSSTSVLLVRTNGLQNLPILVLGRRVATTDRDGVAQTTVTGAPGDEIEVIIDTSSDPKLCPEMPRRRLKIPETSQILVFDQSLKKRVTKTKKVKRAPKFTGPKRI